MGVLQERRLAAVRELARLLKPGGQGLVYVWAFEQEYNKQKSKYLKDNNKESRDHSIMKDSEESQEPEQSVHTHSYSPDENLQHASGVTESKLGVHTNRTAFSSQDLLVPWHLKGGKTRVEQEPSSGLSSRPDTHPGLDSSVLSGSRPHSSDSKQSADAGHTSAPVFHRYYHVFEQGELEQLCAQVAGVQVKTSYHDQGNWCVVLEKE